MDTIKDLTADAEELQLPSKLAVAGAPPQSSLPSGNLNIALSFSGGGFRAASFTLGCASYLNEVKYQGAPLLHKVKFISSASGGTITSLVLSSMLQRGKSFDEAYKFLLQQMTGCNLMDKVFEIFANDDAWKERPEKSRNLINAFAMAYDKHLFDNACLGLLSEDSNPGQFTINEVSVNATDFYNGLNFRFGTSGVVGNRFLRFKGKTADKIRLGDILACSSCFPAGFEPVMFPYDFTWTNGNTALTQKDLGESIVVNDSYTEQPTNEGKSEIVKFGLMDGGIDDNQGIYSFLLSDGRKKGFDYDLYFPCDVSSNYINEVFKYPGALSAKDLKPSVTQTIRRWKRRAIWFIVACLIVTAGSIVGASMGIAVPVLTALAGAAFVAAALPVIVGLVVKGKIKKINKNVDSRKKTKETNQPPSTWKLILNKYKSHFLDLPLNRLLQMLEARMDSVLMLADTVYLKKIRRLSYDHLHSEKAIDVYDRLVRAHNKNPSLNPIDTEKLWRDHIALTAVYLLSSKNDHKLQELLNQFETIPVSGTSAQTVAEFLQPSEALRKVADTAAKMDTTLWFDENHVAGRSMESLVAAGQATMCFNLLRTSYRFSNNDAAWLQLRQELIGHWQQFQLDPFWLYNQKAGNG